MTFTQSFFVCQHFGNLYNVPILVTHMFSGSFWNRFSSSDQHDIYIIIDFILHWSRMVYISKARHWQNINPNIWWLSTINKHFTKINSMYLTNTYHVGYHGAILFVDTIIPYKHQFNKAFMTDTSPHPAL